jgi:uncharacterized membrane protein YbhN (UPF0104 family)
VSKNKALRALAETAPVALPRALAGAARRRYRRVKERGEGDAGSVSLEYAILAAVILAVVVLLAAAVVKLLGVKIAAIESIT